MSTVELTIHVPDTVEELLALCTPDEEWTLIVHSEHIRRRFRRDTPSVTLGSATVKWSVQPTFSRGIYYGRCLVPIQVGGYTSAGLLIPPPSWLIEPCDVTFDNRTHLGAGDRFDMSLTLQIEP
jgi:hypothetical protein